MIRSSRGGGEGTTSHSTAREQKVQRLKEGDMFGGESQLIQYCYCVKFTMGQRGQARGPSEVKALY